MTRRHVLGDIYAQCDAIVSVPVYVANIDEKPERIGHVDEALGQFADAFSFHMADDYCKRLSSGQYTYSFEYDYVGRSMPGIRRRIKIKSITLNARKGYPKPEPKIPAKQK